MLYKPEYGKFKDVSVFYHDGVYYLFAMYGRKIDEYNNVWMAVSDDGVHWTGVGPVIENAPFPVWAMNVHRVGDRFILNHGSFTEGGVQGVIKLWSSSDLYHWSYMGEECDILPPKGISGARLDCMAVLTTQEDGKTVYYGYPTSPYPLMRSGDGIHWSFEDAEHFIEWEDVPPTPSEREEGEFEVSGCVKVNGTYYYLGGWFNYLGDRGYHVHTLRGKHPRGPFSPDGAAYRLCGNSKRWVSIWARMHDTGDEILAASYMNEGYSYEMGETWMPPVKLAQCDERGHLRLCWWPNNERIKGAVLDSPCPEKIELAATEHPATGADLFDGSLEMIEQLLPVEQGVVIEFTLTLSSADKRLTSPCAGIFLEEEPDSGTAIWMNAHGETSIGRMRTEGAWSFDPEDTLCLMTAAQAGIQREVPHTFRLLIRGVLFELYQDDVLVQTFNTTHSPDEKGKAPVRLGFLVRNGYMTVENLRMWSMSI